MNRSFSNLNALNYAIALYPDHKARVRISMDIASAFGVSGTHYQGFPLELCEGTGVIELLDTTPAEPTGAPATSADGDDSR